MSNINENILNSLAILEQNLKEINSAKNQVNNVVNTSENLAKVIETYQNNFESLSKNVNSILEDSRKFNIDSIEKLSKQTKSFSDEITKLSEFDFSKSLQFIESEAIKHFEDNLLKPIDALNGQTKKIEEEVVKLTEINFQESFNKIEKEVINQFNTDFKKHLDIFDEKAQEIQIKINEFKSEISRLEEIDLKLHFNEILNSLTNLSITNQKQLLEELGTLVKQNNNLSNLFIQQKNELKNLKFILIAIIGILTISTIVNFVLN